LGEPLLCQLCLEPRGAVARCRLCGRPVCSAHWDAASGLCTACREALCSVCRERLAVASCSICGRPVCSACGIQVTPAVRLCPDCARRYGARWPPRELVERFVSGLRLAVRRLGFEA